MILKNVGYSIQLEISDWTIYDKEIIFMNILQHKVSRINKG